MDTADVETPPRWKQARWLDPRLAAAVTIVAGLIRFIRLDIPRSVIPLDEFYYPVNALGLLRVGADQQGTAADLQPAFAVHPPVGKWIIAAGIKAFGYNSFGWRFMAALFGTLSVLVLYLLVRRLTRSPWIAAGAGLLLAVDGIQVVQSRIAMLDIFLSFFILLAVWLLIEDAYRTKSGHRGPRWWRLAAGVAIGLAAATKWSGAFVIPFLAVLALVWDALRVRRGAGGLGELFERFRRAPAPATEPATDPSALTAPSKGGDLETGDLETGDLETGDLQTGDLQTGDLETGELETPPDLPPVGSDAQAAEGDAYPAPEPRRVGPATVLYVLAKLGFTFIAIPLAIYMVSYVPWFRASDYRFVAPRCEVQHQAHRQFNEWLCNQREILDYHRNLRSFDAEGKPIHPYLSHAWSWPWIGRPTAHYWDQKTIAAAGGRPETKRDAEIVGIPNPGLWFPAFFLALPLCLWWAIRRRDHIAGTLVLLFVPLFVPWLPWFARRPLFMFYMTPAVPLLVAMLAHVIARMRVPRTQGGPVALGTGALVLPFAPLYIQWCATGTATELLYKIPALAAVVLLVGFLVSIVPEATRSKRLGVAVVGMSLAMFAYFYPVLAAVHISHDGWYGWNRHMWLQADCASTTSSIEIACWI